MVATAPAPKIPTTKEEELAGLSYLQQLYQNQYSSLAQSINGALERLADLNNTHTTLDGMEKVTGKPILTPVGSEAYLFSTASTKKTLLVHIGANYLAEKTTDEAKGFISKQIERQTAFVNNLIKNRNDVENALLEVSYRIDELTTES
jgi:prefoldin alpha subunit